MHWTGTGRHRRGIILAATVVALASVLGVLIAGDGWLAPLIRWGIARALPWPNGTVALGGASREGLHAITLTGVRLTADPDGNAMTLDTLRLEFRIREMFGSPRRLRGISLIGLRFEGHQADTGWAWTEPFGGDSTASAGMRIDRIEVRDAALTLTTVDGGRLIDLDSMTTSVSGLVIDSSYAFRIDTLGVRLGHAGIGAGHLAVSARGAYDRGVVQLDTLVVTDTTGGFLVGAGTLEEPTGSLDFRFVGRGIHLAQAHAAVADYLAQEQAADLDATVRGTTALPEINATLAFDRAGRIRATSQVDLRGDSTTLVLGGNLESLDVTRISGGRFRMDPVIGKLDGRLNVTVPDSVDGPVSLDLESTMSGRPIRLAGRASFLRGLATVALDATVADKSAHITGTLRPSGAVTYDLEARITAELPLPETVAPRIPEARGPWNVIAHLAGTGASAEEALGTVRARFETSGPSVPRGTGALEARFGGGRLNATGALQLAGAAMKLEGGALLNDPASTWVVRRLALRDVRLAPWLEQAAPGLLTGWLSAHATPHGFAGEARVDSVEGGSLDGLGIQVGYEVGNTLTRVTGRLTQGTALIQVDSMVMSGAVPQRAHVRFRQVDPSRFLAGAPSARLGGALVIEPVPGGPPPDSTASVRDARLNLRLALDSSTLGGTLLTGEARATWIAGVASYDASFVRGDEEVGLKGTARLREEPFSIDLERGNLRRVDPAAWTGGRLAEGSLSATITGSVHGFDLATALAEFTLTLDSSMIGRRTFGPGSLAGGLREGHATLAGTMRAMALATRIDASADAVAGGAWRGTVQLVLADSLPARVDSLPLHLAFTTPDSVAQGGWQVSLDGTGTAAGIRLDSLEVLATLHDADLQISKLVMTGPDGSLHGMGRTSLNSRSGAPADLVIAGTLPDLGLPLSLAGRSGYRGRASFEFRSSGSGDALRHRLEASLADFRGSGLLADSLDVEVTLTPDSASIADRVEFELAARGPRSVAFAPGDGAMVLGLGTGGKPLPADATPLELAGSYRTAARTIEITRLRAITGADEEWTLDRPVNLVLGDILELPRIRLASRSGHVEVLGRLGVPTAESLAVSVQGLPIELRAAGADTASAARIDLEVRLAGTAAAPQVTVEGLMRGIDEQSVGTRLTADWTVERLRLRVDRPGSGDGRILLEGTLPVGVALEGDSTLRMTGAPVDLRLRIDSLDMASFAALLSSEIEQPRGRLDVDVTVTGAAAAPEFSGQIAVSGMALRLAGYRTDLSSDQLTAKLSGRRVSIVDGEIRSAKNGVARLSGGVEFTKLTSGTWDLKADLSRFRAADGAKLQVTLSGDLTLSGAFDAPELKGKIRIDDGTWHLTADDMSSSLAPVTLTEADYQELERRFGITREGTEDFASAAWDAMTLELEVDVVSNVWIRRTFEPSLAVEMAGALKLRKAPRDDLEAFGEVNVVEGRSTIQEFGRRFTITRGTARFDGPLDKVQSEAQATYKPDSDVTIRLDIKGDASGFSLDLSADPAMSQTDIVWYIATGSPASDATRFGEAGAMTDAGAGLALSRLSAGVEEAARRTLGLDVVEIRQDGLRGITLVAGRYVTRRLYVGFTQPVSFTGRQSATGTITTEVDAEYRATTWLLTNLSGSVALARFFLKSRYAY